MRDYTGVVAKWRPAPTRYLRSHGMLWFDSQAAIDGRAQFLLATEVPFRRLDSDVSKQELDLVEFAAGKMAEPRATAAKICGASLLTPAALPDHLETVQIRIPAADDPE